MFCYMMLFRELPFAPFLGRSSCFFIAVWDVTHWCIQQDFIQQPDHGYPIAIRPSAVTSRKKPAMLLANRGTKAPARNTTASELLASSSSGGSHTGADDDSDNDAVVGPTAHDIRSADVEGVALPLPFKKLNASVDLSALSDRISHMETLRSC